MPDLTRDFQSLTRFRRQLDSQSALDLAARQDTREGIRQGLEDAKKHRTRIAREVFATFEARRGIPG